MQVGGHGDGRSLPEVQSLFYSTSLKILRFIYIILEQTALFMFHSFCS